MNLGLKRGQEALLERAGCLPNIGLQLTASSVRSCLAPASGSS